MPGSMHKFPHQSKTVSVGRIIPTVRLQSTPFQHNLSAQSTLATKAVSVTMVHAHLQEVNKYDSERTWRGLDGQSR